MSITGNLANIQKSAVIALRERMTAAEDNIESVNSELKSVNSELESVNSELKSVSDEVDNNVVKKDEGLPESLVLQLNGREKSYNGISEISESWYAPEEPGTSGQILKSKGAAAPAWEDFGATRSATIVVAASDAAQTMKAAADYICTGTNDHTQINAAIRALGSKGGKVVLSEGTFLLPRTGTITISSNVVLEGQGEGTIIEKRIENSGDYGENIIVLPEGTHDSCIKDMQIIYNYAYGSATSKPQFYLIDVQGSQCKLENLIVLEKGTVTAGTMININGNYNHVYRCTVATKSSGANGIALHGDYGTIEQCNISVIGINNRCINVMGNYSKILCCTIDPQITQIYLDQDKSDYSRFDYKCELRGQFMLCTNNLFHLTGLEVINWKNSKFCNNLFFYHGRLGTYNSAAISFRAQYSRITDNLFILYESADYSPHDENEVLLGFGSDSLGKSEYSVIINNTLQRIVPEDSDAGTYTISVESTDSSMTGCVVENNICVPMVIAGS